MTHRSVVLKGESYTTSQYQSYSAGHVYTCHILRYNVQCMSPFSSLVHPGMDLPNNHGNTLPGLFSNNFFSIKDIRMNASHHICCNFLEHKCIEVPLYNWLIWRVLCFGVFFKKVFSLYLSWRLEQSEQRHLYVDIFLWDL